MLVASWVLSMTATTSPALTMSPSRTLRSRITPPFSLWITWVWLEGMTLPSPRVISSSTAKFAQIRPTATMPITANSSRWPNRRVPSRSVSEGSIHRSRLVSDMISLPSFSAEALFARLDAAAHQRFEHAGLRAIGHDLAAVEHDQPVDQGQHGMAMRHQHDGAALGDSAQAL